MGLRTWVKGLFGKPEVKPMSYPSRPDPWAQSPQTIDRILDENGAVQPLSIGDAVVSRERWEDRADEILGDREWDSFLSLSSDERLMKVSQLQVLIQTIEENSGKAELWRQCGRLFHAEGDTTQSHDFWLKALASYDKEIEFKPDDHAAWHNRGNSLDDLGRREEAIVSWEKAIEIKPDYDAAWYNRGLLLYKLSRYEESIESCEKAIEIKPDVHVYWLNCGSSLYQLGRHEEAIASYEKAIELNPDYHQAWTNRGGALSALGRNEEAIESSL
jgi:tetratricopeptide (TPR) repeat protein